MSTFHYIADLMELALDEIQMLKIKSKVSQVTGNIIKASIPNVKIGEICILRNPNDNLYMRAEVIGFVKENAILTPIGDVVGISSVTEVIPTGREHMVGVGSALLGRVLNGMGKPMDEEEKGPIEASSYYPVFNDSPDPLKRTVITKHIATGIRAIDSFLTCGEGQRLGIFSAAGVGKSTTIAMIVGGASVDVVVVALIGERGREVREFLERDLGPEKMKKAVIICATSDKSAVERVRAAYVATAVAEYFRDQGSSVLFLMDSVTRFARAQREIGLAAGEPPSRRGFPPSVFSLLPKLMERVGNNDKGSITAIYTVLVEGDDLNEPIADETRSILDGHIILSRKLAASGIYPAIDVLSSVSRLAGHIITDKHKLAANRIRELLSKYSEIELLLKIGEYKQGSDKLSDEAIKKFPDIQNFLKQGIKETIDFNDSVKQLIDISGIQ